MLPWHLVSRCSWLFVGGSQSRISPNSWVEASTLLGTQHRTMGEKIKVKHKYDYLQSAMSTTIDITSLNIALLSYFKIFPPHSYLKEVFQISWVHTQRVRQSVPSKYDESNDEWTYPEYRKEHVAVISVYLTRPISLHLFFHTPPIIIAIQIPHTEKIRNHLFCVPFFPTLYKYI